MSERGYGHEHRKARAEYITAFTPGDPCARCGEPMWDTEDAHLDHNEDRTGYLGLSHGLCNTVAGGLSRMKRNRPILRKNCVECRQRFSTSYPQQQACSVECRRAVSTRRRAERRRAARLATAKQVVIELRPCELCGTLHAGRGRFCDERCRALHNREACRARYRAKVGIPIEAPLTRSGRPRTVAA